MENQNFTNIKTPTALLNERQARENIQLMAEKAASQNIRFRPHFKTHQSAEIGEWFRQEGVNAITVSSVSMAIYFSEHGWNDILIALPVNLREISEINQLAGRVDLSLLVESQEVVSVLDEEMANDVSIWIKVDTGLHRAGILWEQTSEVESLCKQVLSSKRLHLAGLLTHAGQTYHANSTEEIELLYSESNHHLVNLRNRLSNSLNAELQISVGDTPGCWLSQNLGSVDEIRPGNFLLFDAMMMDLGVCEPSEVAIAVACPVVAKHRDRNEVVIYGGSIHLSKEFLLRKDNPIYGYVLGLNSKGWKFLGRNNYVLSLSQEHGVVRLTDDFFDRVKVGGLLGVLPVHSCLVVDALGYLVDFEGNRHDTMRVR